VELASFLASHTSASGILPRYRRIYSFTDTPWPEENPYFDSIGVKRYGVDLTYTDRINTNSEAVSARHSNVWEAFTKEGKRVGIALPLAFRMGYTF
jgi:hypothetical protein